MKRSAGLLIPALCLMLIYLETGCTGSLPVTTFENNSKPYTRYWWFASMIQEEDVKYNLNWLKENGFPAAPVLAWNHGAVFGELAEKKIRIKAVTAKRRPRPSLKLTGAGLG